MKYIVGGIGDFLQATDSALLEEEPVLVYSHQSGAKDFFEGIGVEVEINPFSKLEEIKDDFRISISEPLSRDFYQDFDLPDESLQLAKRYKEANHSDKILGIHPVGSDFSNELWGGHNMPLKKIPLDFFKDMVSFLCKDFRLLVFGTSSELKEYKMTLLESKMMNKINFVSCENIWDSLAHVLICDKIVAVDSAIKSMASVKNIPSVVFVGNYVDKTRDSLFLDQYVGDGVMKVIKFTELKEKELKELKLCLE